MKQTTTTQRQSGQNLKFRAKLAFLIVIIISMSFAAGQWYVLAQTEVTLYPDAYAKTASYIIFIDGSTYYAIDGTTGERLTSGTVASTVIQAAVDALTSGGIVYLRVGVYELSSSLTLRSYVALIGEKRGYSAGTAKGTVLKLADSVNDDVITTPFSENYVDAYVTIKDLTIDGNKANNPTSGKYAINFRVWRGLIQNVKIFQAKGGIHIYGDANNAVENRISDVTIEQVDEDGIFFEGTKAVDNFVKGVVVSNARYGIYDQGKNNIVTQCHLYGCTYGIYIRSQFSQFKDSAIEANKQHGIYIYPGTNRKVLIQGCIFYGNGAAANVTYHDVFADGTVANWVDGLSIIGCKFVDITPTNRTAYNLLVEYPNHEVIIADNSFGGYNTSSVSFVFHGSRPETLQIRNNYDFVNINTVSFSSISNGSYVAHGLAGQPDYLTITLSVQGYAWYGTTNSTHVQVYGSAGTLSGTMYAEYVP